MNDRTDSAMRAAASDEMLRRSCVNLIGLDEIKAEVGPRWEKIKASVWVKLENLLHKKLSVMDFYTQIDDTSFLVNTPSATSPESQIFCLRVAHELHISLLGSREIAKLRLFSVTGLRDDVFASALIAGSQLAVLARSARLAEDGGPIAPGPKARSSAGGSAKPVFPNKFTLIWDAQREAVTTYRCVSAEPNGYDGAGPDVRDKLALAVTISRIVDAAEVLVNHLEAGVGFLMWIPIAFDVLTSPVGRMEIAGVCRSLPSDLRPYLIFEVSDLPLGVPQSRLSELAGSLRPFCGGVAAHLPAQMPNYGAYQGAGLHAKGLSFSASGARGTDMVSELFKLGLAAKKQPIKSFVFDVPHHDLLQLLRELGIGHASSPLVGEALDAPKPAKRLLLQDIAAATSHAGVAA